MRITATRAIAPLFLMAACSAKAPTVSTPASANGLGSAVATLSDAGAKVAPRAVTEQEFLAPFLQTATEARGLAPLLPVQGERVDRARMLAVVRAHVDAEVPEEDIVREEIELALYGLIPPDYKYKEGFFKLLESELAGVYIPTDKKLYYSSDLGDGERETIVHELTHALQDQHFHLGGRMKALKNNDDAGFALQVLAEGDATFTGLRTEITKRMGPNAPAIPVPQLRAMMEQGVAASMAKIDAPPAMKRMLAAPYIEGVSLVGALFEEGGWARVNEAWARPPASSHQALDVHRWATQDRYETAAVLPAPAGFKVVHSGASGEYGVRALWEQWAPTSASELASKTLGDVDALYINDAGDSAVMSRIQFYPPRRPTPFDHLKKIAPMQSTFMLYTRHLSPLFQQKGWSNEGAFHCLQRPGVGPFAVSILPSEVRVSAGPASKSAAGWSTTATCADAKKWHAAVK